MNAGNGIVTDADRELCRKIAQLEYPDAEIRDGKFGLVIIDDNSKPIPAYLTSDSEFRRMLEALYMDGWVISKHYQKTARCWPPNDNLFIEDDDLVVAVAQAYLAMLKAEKEAKT